MNDDLIARLEQRASTYPLPTDTIFHEAAVALAKARDTALEDAAKVCNDIIYVPHGDGSYTGMFRHFGNQQCAAAIRAMKGK